MPRKNLPGYLKHKTTGQAFCVINGKFIYLGKYGSKASRERYEEVIGEYLANGKKLPPVRSKNEITITEFAVDYLGYAKEYYADDPGTYNHCEHAMKPLIKHYGNCRVSEFGPLSLKFVREKWIEMGHSLTTIRKREGQLKSAFRWALENEFVSAEVTNAICLVRGLKKGRSKARDPEEVFPVSDEIVEKTLPHLPPIIADMVRVHRLCGMRSQDVINLRGCDIDRSKTPWKYTPHTHKTKKRGKTRWLAIGPRAQAVLMPYLIDKQNEPEAFFFSPKDTMQWLQEEKRRKRKTKVQPSQVCRKKKNPQKQPKTQYSVCSYGRAIRKVCLKLGIEPWSPHQLRHSTGTEVRDKYGLDYAQAVLGHASAKTTEIYAKVSFEKAAAVMEEIG